MSNHQKRGLAANGTRGSILRKALSYFLAIMLAVTLIPLASIGAPDQDVVEPLDSNGLELIEEGEAAEDQGEAPALEALDPAPELGAPALEAVDPEVIIEAPALDPTAPAVDPVGPAVQAPGIEGIAPGDANNGEFADIRPLDDGGIGILSDAEQVSTWQQFRTAWANPSVSQIEITASIRKDTTAAGDRLPALSRSLHVQGATPDIVVDFNSGDTLAANNFALANRTAAQQSNLTLENLTIIRGGTTALISSPAASPGWNITLRNIKASGAPTSRLLDVAQSNLTLAGSVAWQNTATTNPQITTGKLTVAPSAQIQLSRNNNALTTAVGSLINVVDLLEVGQGATLDLSGGGYAVNFSGSAAPRQATATFAANTTLSITNARDGLFLGHPPTAAASAAASKVDFGSNSTVTISVLNEAIRATDVRFRAGSVANINATNASDADATPAAVNLGIQGANLHAFFGAYDGAKVTITAVGGNGLSVGSGTGDQGTGRPASAKIEVLDKAHLIVNSNGTGHGGYNAVVTAMANSGGFTVTGGGQIQVNATRTNVAFPGIIQQITGGTFVVDGEDSKLEVIQHGSYSGYTAAVRFRILGGQTFRVTNDGEVLIKKLRHTGAQSAGIRFGDGSNNNFFIENGGLVNVTNEGNGTVTIATNTAGGNEAVEFNRDGFTFEVKGASVNRPSACQLIARFGSAIDAGSWGGGDIKIGPGTVFEAIGTAGANTGAVTSDARRYSTINATGPNFNFEIDSPLYYDMVNRRTDGGSVFNLGSGANWKSKNSDAALWIAGRNDYDSTPSRSFTLIDYELRKTAAAWNAWTFVNGDAGYKAWWDANDEHRMGSYTRISGNNAKPNILGSHPATNADKYVRWMGTVGEGFDQKGRAFWDDEVFGIIEVTKANTGEKITFEAEMTLSIEKETVYSVEKVVQPLEGVLRFDNDGSFLEAGDTYKVLQYWRGGADPNSSKRHEVVDASGIAPIVVTDVVPPLPATTITPDPFYANQRSLSGTWTKAANDNPPDSMKAMLKRGTAAAIPLEGTPTLNTDSTNTSGTWSFNIASGVTLQEDDQIFIVFTDATGNEQPLVDTPKRDMMIPAAASVMVQAPGTSIIGTLFTDEDRNGFFSNGDERLAGKEVLLYRAGNLTTHIDTATTNEQGEYIFVVDPGSYVIKAPAHPGYGYTSLITVGRTPNTIYNDVNNNGFSGTLTVNNDNEANLTKTANAGYAIADKNLDPGAFTKDLVKVGGEVTNGPIHDSTADLTYEIAYKMPVSTAGYNQITLLDIMDPGLVLKDGNAAANIQVRAVAKDGSDIPIEGTAAYAAGTGDLAGTMVASYTLDDETSYVALNGATIIMTVTAKLEKVDNAWPTLVTNKARLLVNGGTDPFVDDEENKERNIGLISGFAFVDSNYNGVFDVSETGIEGQTIVLKVWNGTEYVAYTPTSDDQAVTDSNGAYKFEVPAGLYRIEFPTPVNGMGITTTLSDNSPGSEGVVENIRIELGTAAQQTRTISAGYNEPGPDKFIDDLIKSFDKSVDDGSGTFVKNRSVTDIDEELLYKISFIVPEPDPGVTPFAGFYAIELKDVMDPGLAFANVAAGSWNWQIKVGNTVVTSGVATGNEVDYTFSPAGIQQYLVGAAPGTEVALMVKANMVQVDGQWPTKLTNRGYLHIPARNGDKNAEKELILDAQGQAPVIDFTQYPLVVKQTRLVDNIMTKDALCAALKVTDAEDYPNWISDTDGRNQDLYKNMVVTVLDSNGQPTDINTANVGVHKVRYVAKDSNNNITTEYRAVVVSDGRYVIEEGKNGVIIGARNFVVKQSAVQRSESAIKGLSYAEAFKTNGDPIEVSLKDGIPAGYTTGTAQPGEYPFVWAA
ncbi:MAG: hypothetical protein FWD27_08380, partial [Coriobacteriia bacterium]|nr:hypothetical protein [Coriobacteriia bacterium]